MFDVFHHRARAVTEAADIAGVQLADGDPLDAAHAPFELFHRGQLQEVERTLWRSGDKHNVRVFEYRYETVYGDQRDRSPLFSCATALVNASWPALLVAPSPLHPEREELDVGGTDIQLESDEFNEAFRVHGPDQRFAYAFLDAGMQEFLLAKGRAITLQVRGTWLLALTEHIPAELLPNLFPFVDDLLARIPSVVESLYPPPLPGGSDTPVPEGAFPTGVPTDPSLMAQRNADDLLSETSSLGRGMSTLGAAGVGADAVEATIAAEIIEDPSWQALDHGHFDGLHDATADEPEFDLDGKPITPHQEDPWGPGLPEHGEEGTGAAET